MTAGPTGTVFRIARSAVHDGPGIRTTVFLKGCPLRCWWCHSPESQAGGPELLFNSDRCTGCGTCLPACPNGAILARSPRGIRLQPDSAQSPLEEEERPSTVSETGRPPTLVPRPPGWVFITDRSVCVACAACVRACPSGAREMVGQAYTVDALVAELVRDVVFFDESGGGVTFSGGEPLRQAAFLEAVLERCRDLGIHTAVDTCGLADPEVLERVAKLAGLFLYDLKVADVARHRELTGVSNERILANLEYLVSRRARVRIRLPLVPGVNDDEQNLAAIGRLVASLGLSKVDILPYHRAGLAKYDRLQEEPRLPDTLPPTDAALAAAVSTLEGFGLEVRIGG